MAETVFSLPDRASGPHWAITAALGDPDWQYRWVDLDGYGVAYTPHGAQTEHASTVAAGARALESERGSGFSPHGGGGGGKEHS